MPDTKQVVDAIRPFAGRSAIKGTIQQQIRGLLDNHGTGRGVEKDELDDHVEKKLTVLSKIQDNKEKKGPVPPQLKATAEKKPVNKTAFERGYNRVMKVAGMRMRHADALSDQAAWMSRAGFPTSWVRDKRDVVEGLRNAPSDISSFMQEMRDAYKPSAGEVAALAGLGIGGAGLIGIAAQEAARQQRERELRANLITAGAVATPLAIGGAGYMIGRNQG